VPQRLETLPKVCALAFAFSIASTTDSAAVHNSPMANRGRTLQITASGYLPMAKDFKIEWRANSAANALTTAARTSPTDGQLPHVADNVNRLPWPMTPISAGAPTSPTTHSLSPCAPRSRQIGAYRCRQRPALARPWPRAPKVVRRDNAAANALTAPRACRH
jgi:hypothetical protein